MIKRSPSRNHRSKGMKTKHILQIILLLGVCLWLIYQVKHSHDKKKEFDKNDAKVSARTQTADHILKLGRKDLHPGKDKVNQNEKQEEEEEDENIVEDEENKHEHDEQEQAGNMHETEENEDNKHEVREQGDKENKNAAEEHEEDENRSEEIENEGRGGEEEDEVDDNDQEKMEADTDRDEEFMDEEKEKEEVGDDKENEEKGDSAEDHNTHEAREEHYKADDASSAVTHDTHTTNAETETVSLENSDVNSEMSTKKPANKPNYAEESNRNQNDKDFKVTEAELTTSGTFSNATTGKDSGNNVLSSPVDTSHLNKTATTNSDSHLEASSNLTVVTTGASNNLMGTRANTSTSSDQNNMAMLSKSNQAENNTVNTTVTEDVKNVQTEGLEQGGNRVSEDNLPDSKSAIPVKTENGDGDGAGELEKTIRSVASNETENNSRNSDRKESIDGSDDEKSKGDTETSETNKTNNNSFTKDATENEKLKVDNQTDETSGSSSGNGTSDSVEHDATDSSNSHVLNKDVTEIQTDPDTLPDIRNEGNNGEEAAAE